MAETIRTVRKQGAKNREINESLKEVMQMIKANREKKKKGARNDHTNRKNSGVQA
jgi:hypothetical protein